MYVGAIWNGDKEKISWRVAIGWVGWLNAFYLFWTDPLKLHRSEWCNESALTGVLGYHYHSLKLTKRQICLTPSTGRLPTIKKSGRL
jgi:hypothetical protein